MTDDKASNAMWGGRFASGPAAVMEAINASIDFDRRSTPRTSAARRRMRDAGRPGDHLPRTDARAIAGGLDTIRAEIEAGRFAFSTRLEDIHMNVEARLAELIGPAAGRLHTARSRNDQVAIDFRLWVREDSAAPPSALEALIARPARQGRGACRDGDARLHPPADRAAGDLRPPPAWPMSRCSRRDRVALPPTPRRG